jgi:FecR protein
MKLSRLKIVATSFLAGVLALPAWAAKTGQPGSVNYVEGQVSINEQPVDTQSIGSLALQPGQLLTTSNGKAEMLLTPGVFLRVDNASSIEMISASLTNTEVKLDEGRAMVDVSEIHAQNNLRVTEDGVTTQLVKTGLYDFDAAQKQIRVFSGKAVLFDGDHEVTIDGGHQVDLNREGGLKAEKFNKDSYQQSDLYRWSSLRSSYLAEANVDAARDYVNDGYYGSSWAGAGWYWDPWYGSYTFIPADGIFYSPFGWGFYSPLVIFGSPEFFVGHHRFHHFDRDFRPGFERGRGFDEHGRGFQGRPGLQPGPGAVHGPDRPGQVVRGPSEMHGPSHGSVSGGAGAIHSGGSFHGGGGGGFHGGGGGHAGGGSR